jgi:ethanolamine utilization microcompartment shell protein EutS
MGPLKKISSFLEIISKYIIAPGQVHAIHMPLKQIITSLSEMLNVLCISLVKEYNYRGQVFFT